MLFSVQYHPESSPGPHDSRYLFDEFIDLMNNGKRTDIKSILIIGAGPIIIGQACEFDYSGTQAIRALKEEGYRVVLINSNPATIMTDPDLADATYIEPLTREYSELVIIKERPDAILPTVGGQTGLNLALELHKNGFLEKNKVKLIGAQASAIEKAEDREKFKIEMEKVEFDTAKGGFVKSTEQAKTYLKIKLSHHYQTFFLLWVVLEVQLLIIRKSLKI